MNDEDHDTDLAHGTFEWAADSSSTEQVSAYGKLPPGLTIDDLRTAITYSGYPLQAAVASAIQNSLTASEGKLLLQEEWAYLDAELDQIRSIDIFVELHLGRQRCRANPFLNVLVECKQSEMPYIFFLRESSLSQHYDFPEIAGLPGTDIFIYPENEDGSIGRPYSMSLHDVFAFYNLPFFEFPCPFAISVSKAARKGNKVALTGEDAYRALTLPLMKAADHLKSISQPKKDNTSFACRMIVSVAVLRAPMLGVYRTKHGNVMAPLPWVRVCRLEPQQAGLPFRTQSIVRYYDCVHEDYLPGYLDKMLDDARAMGSRLEKSADVVADGRGVAGDEEDTHLNLRAIRNDEQISDPEVESLFRIARRREVFELGLRVRKETNGEEAEPGDPLQRGNDSDGGGGPET